jgi:ACS family glucarate transporter-like MFS transporter
LSMLLYVDRVCISSAKEHIARDLHLSDTQMGWVLSIFALGYALGQVPTGLMADRLGPRLILSAVVTAWSIFTALTAAVRGFIPLLGCRFLFGVGEAGAFPACARAVYSWIPMTERGLVQGLMFSGARFGAAFTLPLVAWMVSSIGWRHSFIVLGVIGIGWAAFWYCWFRDDPVLHKGISEAEREFIIGGRQQSSTAEQPPPLTARRLMGSKNVWLLMSQYFSSNFTFFFSLSWLFPYLKSRYSLGMVEAGFYAAIPPLAGAFGNWTAGALIDWIYRRGNWLSSRRTPAIAGFILAAAGLLACSQMSTPVGAIACLALAVFGADMTIAPSWTVCIDIGQKNSGAVSGTMNMAGNLGSFVTALAFPYLLKWTGSHTAFFYVGTGLNLAAIAAWYFTKPDRKLEDY